MSFWSWIKGKEVTLEARIRAVVKSKAVQELLNDELGKIARAVVAELANASELTSTQKREESFARVLTAASAAGIDFTHRAINLALELIVAEIQPRVL